MRKKEIYDAMLNADCPADEQNMMQLKELAMAAKIKAMLAYMNACVDQSEDEGRFSDSNIMELAGDLLSSVMDDDAETIVALMDEVSEYSGPVDLPVRNFKPCPATIKYVAIAMAMEIGNMHELGTLFVICDNECNSTDWKNIIRRLRAEAEDEDESIFKDLY